ncbi:MAG: hypothetical protein ABS81_10230 [Pseudonocardia sp. SCN 72-86]|nr:MAG: hypothetical protein ABS81_10230 [Pseudonocardia sp. SCN 72-86]
MTGRLEGRVALVTGAARGIGAAVVDRFRAEGAVVVAFDIDGPSPCDVSDETAVAAAVGRTLAEHGHIDVLVNNAGIQWPDGPVHETAPDVVSRVLAVNLAGMFHTAHHVLPSMLEQGAGSIVNMASVGALKGSTTSHAYGASKGGVVSFTRALAVTYAGRGIRANALCPGLTRTPMVERLGPGWIADAAARTPAGRLAEPAEIAAAALFLASDEASFVNGAVLPVDGGRTAS